MPPAPNSSSATPGSSSPAGPGSNNNAAGTQQQQQQPPFPAYAAAAGIVELMTATVTEPMASAGISRPCTAPFLHAAHALAAVDRHAVVAATCTLELGQAGAAMHEATVSIILGPHQQQLRLTASCPFSGASPSPPPLDAEAVATRR